MKQLIFLFLFFFAKSIINKGKQEYPHGYHLFPWQLYWRRLSKSREKAFLVRIKTFPARFKSQRSEVQIGVGQRCSNWPASAWVTTSAQARDPRERGGASHGALSIRGWDLLIAWLGMTNCPKCNVIKVPTNQCGKKKSLFVEERTQFFYQLFFLIKYSSLVLNRIAHCEAWINNNSFTNCACCYKNVN